jgi:hypothetical protein
MACTATTGRCREQENVWELLERYVAQHVLIAQKVQHLPSARLGSFYLRQGFPRDFASFSSRLQLSAHVSFVTITVTTAMISTPSPPPTTTTTTNFDVHMSVHRKYISKVQPTSCNVFSIYLFLLIALHVSDSFSAHRQER